MLPVRFTNHRNLALIGQVISGKMTSEYKIIHVHISMYICMKPRGRDRHIPRVSNSATEIHLKLKSFYQTPVYKPGKSMAYTCNGGKENE